MTYIRDMPITQLLDIKGSRYSQFKEEFYFESIVLKDLGLPWQHYIPIGFVMDWESIPWFRGANKIAGSIHDFLSRFDAIVNENGKSLITKKMAAKVYMEFLIYREANWFHRWVKYSCVRWLPDFVYFGKKSIYWVPKIKF